MHTAGLVLVEDADEPSSEDAVLAEWREYTLTRVIPLLSDACEWRWVAQQLARGLSAPGRTPPV